LRGADRDRIPEGEARNPNLRSADQIKRRGKAAPKNRKNLTQSRKEKRLSAERLAFAPNFAKTRNPDSLQCRLLESYETTLPLRPSRPLREAFVSWGCGFGVLSPGCDAGP
jgi:hypothetical protein